jgi:DNA mismatch endonuclease (patch repair protein)
MLGNRSESEVERVLRSVLHRRGLRFRKHVRPIRGLRCRPDIVFTRQRIAVFVDGCFWHRCPLHGSAPRANGEWWQRKLDANVARDRRNDEALRDTGWVVLRFWAHETIEDMSAATLAAHAERSRRLLT